MVLGARGPILSRNEAQAVWGPGFFWHVRVFCYKVQMRMCLLRAPDCRVVESRDSVSFCVTVARKRDR